MPSLVTKPLVMINVTYYMSTEIYYKQSCEIKNGLSKPRNNLIGHTMFLTSEKYRVRAVIGHTIFSTSEKMVSVFPPFGAASRPKWECSQLSLLKTKKMKTQKRKLNRILLCLRNF